MKRLLIFLMLFILPFGCLAAENDEISEAEASGLVPESFGGKYAGNITREEYAEVICRLYDKMNTDGEESGEAAKNEETAGENTKTEEKKNEEQKENEQEKEYRFTDTDSKYVKKAYLLGIIKGESDTLFVPDGILTRQEAVTILMRMILKLNPEYDPYLHAEYSFIDDWQISYWAKNYMDFAYYCGIINGTGEYAVSPLLPITRKEALLISVRTMKNIDDYLKGGDGYTGWEWYINPKYDGLVRNTKFCSGRAAVKQNGKYGYIDIKGNTVIGFKYDDAYDFSNGMAKVKQNGKFGYVDRQGREIIPAVYDDGGEFSENLVWVKKDGKYGYLDTNGNVALPFEYEHAYNFTEGAASVKKGGKYGYIDRNGETVIDFKFAWSAEFHEGRARVGEKGRYGYIDRSGEIVIPMKYEQVLDFNDERAAVYYRDFGGIIDRDGNVIVPFFKYSEISSYTGGVTHVRTHGMENPDYSGSSFYLDLNGERIGGSAGNYEFHEGLAAVTYPNLRHGKILPFLRNKKAECVIPSTDDYYSYTDDEKNCYLFMGCSEGICAAVNRSGKLGFIKNPLLKD